MEFKDYYKILGVSDKAAADDIKKAYKKLARKYHPDVSKEADAEQHFKEVAEAYEVLRDKDKRQEYDQLRAMGAQGSQGQFRPPPGWESATHFYEGGSDGDFSDFFSSLFGRDGRFQHRYGSGQGVRMRGEDVHTELGLLLEEAYKGCEQTVQIRVPEVSPQGLVTHQSKKLKIKIPPGSVDGSVLRIRGQGAPGIGGGGAGDLLVTIRLAEHPLYSVEGRNISMVVPVLPSEAALGCKVTVPTLKSRTVVTVPPGSQSGRKLRLPGLGMPGNPPGDFYIVLKVVMPEKISDHAKELYRQLQAEDQQSPRGHWEGEA